LFKFLEEMELSTCCTLEGKVILLCRIKYTEKIYQPATVLAAGSSFPPYWNFQSSDLPCKTLKMNSVETFVLASLKEFVKLWGSGSQATFNLKCINGQVWFHLGARLCHPANPHFYPPNPPQVPQKRKKNPARIEKDLACATEHRAKRDNLAVPALASLSPAAAAGHST
jgi:hypothetical protein